MPFRSLTLPSGYVGCFSYAGVATLTEAPLKTLVKQFYRMYNIGKTSSPPLALTATLCNGFSAYRSRRKNALIGGMATPFMLYVAAAISVMAIVPFTLLYMEPAVNRQLLQLGSQANRGVKAEHLGASEEDVRKLLVRWKGLNFVRATLAGMGALLSAVATIA